jgi:hypothetical protein
MNDVDRPLCWYSPNGDDHYKVVYADLSVHDVTRDELPQKPAELAPKIVGRREKMVRKMKALASRMHGSSTPGRTVRVNTPRFELPRQAIRQYSDLQASRERGEQAQVEYLVLGWMREFVDSQVPPVGAGEEIKSIEVQPDWVSNRSPNSQRFEFLNEFPNLKGIDASHLYLTQRDLTAIAGCTKLERLSLSGIQIHEAAARRLGGADLLQFKGLTELQFLDISQSDFSGGLKYLSELPSLHMLFFSSFENLNDKSVAELKDLPHLQSLIIGPVYGSNPETTVTETGLRSFHLSRTSLQVHLGLSWIEVEASTVEIAGGFEVFTVPVAADSSLN